MADKYVAGGVTPAPDTNVSRSTLNRNALTSSQQQDVGQTRYGMEVNNNYIVRVLQEGKLIAKGYVPETFQLSIQSRYGQPFGQGVATTGSVGTAMKVLGHTTLTSQSMTMQVWEGSEPLELSFEFEFLAESDPYIEVIKPIKDLLKLVMPTTGDFGLLKPPGPQIEWINSAKDLLSGVSAMIGAGVTKESFQEKIGGSLKTAVDGAKGKISIFVGNFLAFDNVVIESVNQTYHSMFDDKGQPLRATVAITFKTFMVPTADDIELIFVPGSTAGSAKGSQSDDRPRGNAGYGSNGSTSDARPRGGN